MIVLGWNVYPVESVSYSAGAKPIPLGSAESKKRTKPQRPLRLCGELLRFL